MKYYHLIFNSSQKNMGGSAGFGVRTVTRGMPERYISLLQTATNMKIFFDCMPGSFTYPSPTALFENPQKILEFPHGYSFAKLIVSAEESIYVLGRMIPVGFDYTYYLKNAAGRLGNFVADYYIFTEFPDAESFQILYENARPDSNHFIPSSPVPDKDNEEMKTISIGQQDLLPEENKSFAAVSLPVISDKAIELLFAYVESRKKGKKLIVRCPWKEAGNLMADLTRLLPEEELPNATFCTNYQFEGLQPAFQIMCINEYYPYTVPPAALSVDLIDNKIIETGERKAYKNSIRKDADDGFFDLIHNQVKWLFSAAYDLVKDKSTETNRMIYAYCIDRESFSLMDFCKNKEAIDVLKQYLSQNDSDRKFLISQICRGFNQSNSLDDYKKMILLTANLRDNGIAVQEVLERNREGVSQFILTSPECLSGMIEAVKWEELKNYVVKAQFEEHFEFLDDKALLPYWEILYTSFYSAKQLSDKSSFVQRILRLRLGEMGKRLINKELSIEEQIEVFINLIKEYPQNVDMLWPYLKAAIEKSGKYAELCSEFAQFKEDNAFAPIFYFEIDRLQSAKSPLLLLEELYGTIRANKKLKEQIIKTFDHLKIYNVCYAAIKEEIKNGKNIQQIGEAIIYYVFPIFGQEQTGIKKLESWNNLLTLLKSDTTQVDNRNLKTLYALSLELNRKHFYKQLLPRMLEAAPTEELRERVEEMKKMSFTEDDMMQMVSAHVTNTGKQARYIFYIWQTNGKDFRYACEHIHQEIETKKQDELLKEFYPKEYKAMRRKMRIKSFFQRIASIFKPNKNKQNNKKTKQ